MSNITSDLNIPGEAGSFDHRTPVEQIKAIRAVLVLYYGTADWLVARRVLEDGRGPSINEPVKDLDLERA